MFHVVCGAFSVCVGIGQLFHRYDDYVKHARIMHAHVGYVDDDDGWNIHAAQVNWGHERALFYLTICFFSGRLNGGNVPTMKRWVSVRDGLLFWEGDLFYEHTIFRFRIIVEITVPIMVCFMLDGNLSMISYSGMTTNCWQHLCFVCAFVKLTLRSHLAPWVMASWGIQMSHVQQHMRHVLLIHLWDIKISIDIRSVFPHCVDIEQIHVCSHVIAVDPIPNNWPRATL